MKSHAPNQTSRSAVAAMAGGGKTESVIAGMMGIDGNTLRKYYSEELAIGHAQANGAVIGALFESATEKGDTTAAIFWLKCRDHWSSVDWTEDEKKLVQLMRALNYKPNDIRDGLLHASAKELGVPTEAVKKLVAKCPK